MLLTSHCPHSYLWMHGCDKLTNVHLSRSLAWLLGEGKVDLSGGQAVCVVSMRQ